MIKLLPFIIIPILLVAGFGLWGIYGNKTDIPKSDTLVSQEPVEVPKTLPNVPAEQNVGTLQAAVDTLVKEVNGLKSANAAVDAKLKETENTVSDLKYRITVLEGATPAPTAVPTTTSVVTTKQSSVYIPVGAGGDTWGDQNWLSLNDYKVTIDLANFPGYKTVTLEGNFRLLQKSGQGNIQLINLTTNQAVTNSQISTTLDSFDTYSSGKFTLASGSNVYAVQVKSDTGTQIQIRSVRLRVDY